MNSGLNRATNFKVFIAYESFESGLKAVEVYQHLLRRFENDFSFDVDFWRFEALQVPSIEQRAAEQASKADMVVIAVDGVRRLAVEFQHWIETWIRKKVGQDSALVFLAKHPSEIEASSTYFRAYLRGVAVRGDMTFIADSSMISAETKERVHHSVQPRAKKNRPVSARPSGSLSNKAQASDADGTSLSPTRGEGDGADRISEIIAMSGNPYISVNNGTEKSLAHLKPNHPGGQNERSKT